MIITDIFKNYALESDLFECLNKMIPIVIKKKWYNAKNLYYETDNDIDEIERTLVKYRINVTGDYIRTSKIKSFYEINLIYQDFRYFIKEECEYMSNKDPKRPYWRRVIKGIAYEDKQILLIDAKTKYDDKITCYNGIKAKKIDSKVIANHRSNPVTSPYVFFTSKKHISKEENAINIYACEYEEIKKEADALKNRTKGVVNLYRTGKYSKTAIALFYKFVYALKVDKIDTEEAEWINNASHGPIMYAEKYSGKAYSYDFVSAYSFIMKDHFMFFPIKKGTFETYTQEEFKSLKHIGYGIYRAIIEKSSDKNINKLFRYSDKNYYTHFDIHSAIESNLNITLIQDGKPNILYYSRECLIQGHKLFGDYVDYCYKLKKEKVPGSKNLLKTLWGALSRIDKVKINFKIEEGFEIYDNKKISEIKMIDDDKMQVDLIDTVNPCETDFCRIKPFILAKARYRLKQIGTPYSEHIKYMHTDSMILDIKLPHLKKIGNDIGKLKYEGYAKKYNIVNMSKRDPKKLFSLKITTL